MTGRKFITKEMLEAARDKGMSNAQTARHYGMHASSIHAACERFGVMLPYAKFAPVMPSKRRDKTKHPETKDDRVKAWSVSPAAIAAYERRL